MSSKKTQKIYETDSAKKIKMAESTFDTRIILTFSSDGENKIEIFTERKVIGEDLESLSKIRQLKRRIRLLRIKHRKLNRIRYLKYLRNKREKKEIIEPSIDSTETTKHEIISFDSTEEDEKEINNVVDITEDEDFTQSVEEKLDKIEINYKEEREESRSRNLRDKNR